MVSYRFRFICIYTLLFCAPCLLLAQSSGVSPYSRYGIGDIVNQPGVQGFSMGETGTALHNDSLTPYFLNLKNPASYYYNRITTFEAGMLNSNVRLSTMGTTHNNSNTYFGYFAIAFPVSKYAGMSFGLRPMSSVGYSINTIGTIDSSGTSIGQTENQYQGTGGINQIHLGLAISPFKNFSAGANLCYLFGNITNTENVIYPLNISAFNSQKMENVSIKDFSLNYGIMYTINPVADWQVTLGATVAPAFNLNANYNLLAVSYIAGIPQYNFDTIQDTNVSGNIRLPLMWGGGITIKKGDQWTFSVDYSMQNWSQYSFFGQSQNLNNSSQMGFGMQYVPKRNLGTFLQRVHYRAGFYYNKTYLDINSTRLNDYGLTLGFGFPIGPNIMMYRVSAINVGIQLGQLGTTDNNLLKEQYFKLMFGFTFNDHWFIKRKYE